MTLFFNSSTVNVQKASIITLTCVPGLLNFFAFTMLVLKNILQLLNKTHNLIVLLSAWLGEEHSDETFRRRVSKKLSLSAFFVMPKFLCQQKLFFLKQKLFFLKFTLDFYWQVCYSFICLIQKNIKSSFLSAASFKSFVSSRFLAETSKPDKPFSLNSFTWERVRQIESMKGLTRFTDVTELKAIKDLPEVFSPRALKSA